MRMMQRHPWLTTRAVCTGKWLQCIGTPERARERFFSARVSEADVVRYAAQLQEESRRVSLDALVLNLPKPKRITTPLLVLGAQRDVSFIQKEVHTTARAYHTEAEFFPDMGHDMMLEPGWQAVADRIDNWLGERLTISEPEVIHADD